MIWQRREIQRRAEKAHTWLLSKLYKEIKRKTKRVSRYQRRWNVHRKRTLCKSQQSSLLPSAHIDDINMKGSSRTSLSLRLSIRISFKRANCFIFNEGQLLAISRRTIKEKIISTELSLPFNIKMTLLVQTKKSMRFHILSGSG